MFNALIKKAGLSHKIDELKELINIDEKKGLIK